MAAPLTNLARRSLSPVAAGILLLGFFSSSANAAFFNLLRQHMTLADIRVDSLVLDKREASVGETLRATVNISNTGMLRVTSSTLTFWAAAGSAASISGASRVTTVQLGTLAPKASLSYVSTITVPAVGQSGSYKIFAAVETSARESNWQNNTGVAPLQIIAASAPSSNPAPVDSSSPTADSSPSTASPDPSTPASSPPSQPPPASQPVASDSNAGAPCDYYASPNGSGTGLSSGSPFTISRFWPVATPGKTLCLMDGTYQGSSNMIVPPSGLSGANGSPITIRALNDGAVTIDGQFSRRPIFIQNNNWLVLEGFNAKSSSDAVLYLFGSFSNNIFRRLVLWDAHIGKNISIISNDCSGSATNNLFEDIAAFGTGRKMVAGGGCVAGDTWTARRVWFRWEGSIYPGTLVMNTNYETFGFTCENCIVTWTGESMPQEYDETDSNGNPIGPHRTNFTLPGNEVTFLIRQRPQDTCTNVRLLGSLAFLPAASVAPFNSFSLTYASSSCMQLRHVFAYVSPRHPQFNSVRGFYLIEGAPTPSNVSAHNITSIRSSAIGDTFQSPWDIRSLVTATSLANLPADANPWIGTTGANLCKRWVNGVPTNQALWPWPMNQRIKAATASAGAYSGPCPGCISGRRGRTATDVTAEIEALLGPMPLQCKAS